MTKYDSQKTSAQSRRKQELRKKRIRIKRIFICLIIIAAFLLGFFVGKKSNNIEDKLQTVEGKISSKEKKSKQAEETVPAVAKPMDYSYEQAISVLNEKSAEDSRYENILSNPSAFPEGLIVGLANNPEMLDSILNYSKGTSKNSMTVSSEELKEKCPLFLQWDERWGAKTYGDNIIAVSGCGPTALSMVIVGLTKNKDATPANVASFAMENDYYMFGTGTMWSLMTKGAASYNLTSSEIEAEDSIMQQHIRDGEYLICSMKTGDFTANGHFIVIYGYDESGYQINDPFCKYRSSIPWTYEQISTQIKSMWAFKYE